MGEKKGGGVWGQVSPATPHTTCCPLPLRPRRGGQCHRHPTATTESQTGNQTDLLRLRSFPHMTCDISQHRSVPSRPRATAGLAACTPPTWLCLRPYSGLYRSFPTLQMVCSCEYAEPSPITAPGVNPKLPWLSQGWLLPMLSAKRHLQSYAVQFICGPTPRNTPAKCHCWPKHLFLTCDLPIRGPSSQKPSAFGCATAAAKTHHSVLQGSAQEPRAAKKRGDLPAAHSCFPARRRHALATA